MRQQKSIPLDYQEQETQFARQRTQVSRVKQQQQQQQAEKIDQYMLPTISAKAWIIVDADTGKVIWGKNEDVRREVASITKIMTCHLVLDLCRRMNVTADSTYVQVSKLASSICGTTAELQNGDLVSIEDLYYGLMLPSGNDAAVTLAENFGVYSYYQSKEFMEICQKQGAQSFGAVKAPQNYFLKEMNQKAKDLGMTQTTYANPHGLINRLNKSTAQDISKLCIEALKDPKFRKIVNTKMHFCSIQEEDGWNREVFWENTNRLLYHGFHGIKTGITTEAGPCLASAYKTHDRNYVIVILGSKTTEDRWPETMKLLEWAIDVYEKK